MLRRNVQCAAFLAAVEDRDSPVTIDPNRPVRVFRNWKRDCWSILQDGVLRASAREVLLADVEFLVRPSGRARMLREGRKNIHAYAVGRLVDWVHPDDGRILSAPAGRSVFYDARRFASFVDGETHAPVHRAAVVHLHDGGVRYRGDALPEAA